MNNYTPLKITLYLENGFCNIADMPFDGILSRLYFDERVENGTFDGNYEPVIPFLKRTDGIYHTSTPQYVINSLGNITFFKAFDLNTYLETGHKKSIQKQTLGGKSGRYKSFILNYELVYTDKIEYYVCGDFEYISKLLVGLRFIGKKASLGWGKISHIDIKEIEEDLSLIKNGVPMRNLPDTDKFNTLPNIAKVLLRLQPPYWKKNRDVSLVSTTKKEVV